MSPTPPTHLYIQIGVMLYLTVPQIIFSRKEHLVFLSSGVKVGTHVA